MKGTLKVLALLAAVFVLCGTAAAQIPGGGDIQSRVIQSGSVNDPGSQLLYIADTGLNLRASGQDDSTDNVADLLFGGSSPGVGEVLVNFLAITNTHPTKAVTIHFRYFNDECTDVLDFLVVLTCSDTLLMNPFDFNIPGAQLDGNAVNTGSRIFGPDISSAFQAITGSSFNSGRFIIMANAAGTVRIDDNETTNQAGGYSTGFDADQDHANILFPSELAASDCNFDATGDFRDESDRGTTAPGNRNVGSGSGFSADNLHVFNASAIWFNHLVGHHTIAVPKAFIPDAGDNDQFLAVAVNAYARPAVDLSQRIGQRPAWSDHH